MSDVTNLIGFMAAVICSIAMAPQVIKIFRTKKTQDLSLGAFSVLATGLSLWLIYGLLIHSFPIMVGNGVGLTFALYIMIMKIIHG